MVHGNGNYTAGGASEEGGDPTGRVRAPEDNAIAFANSAGSQFASETEGRLSDFVIASAGYTIAAALGVSRFAAKTLEVQQIFAEAGAHEPSVTHLAGRDNARVLPSLLSKSSLVAPTCFWDVLRALALGFSFRLKSRRRGSLRFAIQLASLADRFVRGFGPARRAAG